MTILIDHQAFSIQRYGGVSRIFAELIKDFKEDKNLDVICSILYSENEYYSKTNFPRLKSFIDGVQFSLKSKILKNLLPYINNIYTKFYLYNHSVEVYFPSYYDTYLLSSMTKAKKIVFVYDMIHEKYPQYFKDEKISINKKKWLNSSDKIIAISHNTKSDLLKYYPNLSSNKIEVVHLSHSIQKVIKEDLKKNLPKNYILFVGTRGNYKNFQILLDAFVLLLEKYQDYKLLCIGGGAFTAKEKEFLAANNLSNMAIQMSVNDDAFYTIYSQAKAFVFPSLYEGFGIPVIEAMYSGCPVILGKLSSFPEIAEDAGIYADMSNSQDVFEKINMVIKDHEYRNEMIAKGIEQSTKFSWSKTSDKTYEVIRSLKN